MDRPALELQILEELAALRREVREIRNLCACPKASPEGEESAELAELLAAINEEFGDAPWSVTGLFEAAAETVLGSQELAAAIFAIVGGGDSSNLHKRLGVFLARHLGTIEGLRLELIPGRTRDGNRYRVTALSQLTPASKASVKG